MTETMNRYLESIETELEKQVPAPAPSELNHAVTESMRYSLLDGGKRIRPVLTLAFCELCAGGMEAALPFACAVEMIHCYSLIHDDLPCMDNDDMRRGRPSNHIVYGESIAMLAGDALLTKAFDITGGAKGLPADTVVKAVRLLAKLAGADGMVGGQCIDLKHEGKEVDLSVLMEMDLGKTVALISAACQMGCLAAGASQAQITAAAEYAYAVGLAFQIRDDILGAVGDAALLGKTVGLDAENEKRNYVSLMGVEEAQMYVEYHTGQALRALEAFSGDTTFLQELAVSMAKRAH